ncbi:TPA: hypothetical protein ACOVJJ_004970 [Klebsiella oxytoca]
MIAEKLNFKTDDIHFGQIITSCYVVFIVFISLLFPHVLPLVIAPMLLGLLEVGAHLLAIRMSSTPSNHHYCFLPIAGTSAKAINKRRLISKKASEDAIV